MTPPQVIGVSIPNSMLVAENEAGLPTWIRAGRRNPRLPA